MKVSEVEKLLAAFYEGNTSVSEEKRLLDYFETEVIPEHLLADKEFFLALRKTEIPETPRELETKLDHLIDLWAKADEKKQPFKTPGKINWQWITGIAASFLIIASVWMYVDNRHSSLRADTFSNPEDAYNEVQKALILISGNLNKGMNQLEIAQKEFQKVDNILDKQINR